MSQYHFNDNTNSFNSTNFFNNICTNSHNNVWNNCTIADDRSQILTWLSPLDPRLRHQDIQERRVENVGEWLLQTEEFRSWHAGSGECESDNPVLFCYGDPGVGKTYMSSLVIDSLCDRAQGKNVTVGGFYFDFAAQKEQSTTIMLGALLKQLVGGLEKIPEEISRAYRDQRKAFGGRGPRLSDLVKMLQATTSKEPTFICIDALDECVEGHRAKLLDSLNQILQRSPGTRIFVTGRPHIRTEIGRRLAGRVTSLSVSPKRDDIITYLHTKLGEDTTPDAMDSNLEADILRKIPDDISEIFLLVSLNVDAILQETTIHRRRQRLNTMTDGLGLEDVYGATLGRIKGQSGEKARLGISALMWISYAERPLKPDELCHALAVEIGSPSLNTDNVPSIGTLLACCQGLIVVDKEASTVRLVHFTLQEYLRAHPELFSRAHSAMAETCLSYLISQQVKSLSTSLSPDLRATPSRAFPSPIPDLRGTPFLEYSSLYWGVHAERDLSDCAKLLVRGLFDDYNNHISIKILLKARRWHWRSVDFDKPLLFGGLHCASLFGIVEIAAGLIEVGGLDIDQKDCMGYTPLMWAAENGHEGMVEILLELGEANTGKPDTFGRTPLNCAAVNGHESVVKILLERGEVNPDKPDNDGQTPLLCAAQRGHEGVVKILLERGGVNPDKPNSVAPTPLHCAAENGHEGVVRILLERDGVNPDKRGMFSRTPLHCAAWNGHEGVVKILLERAEVDPEAREMLGRTPLHCAAENGHEGLVKILLEWADVNPRMPDFDGQTPLHFAARRGHAGVVKTLLGWGNVNPNTRDRRGRTPLSRATENRHKEVIALLQSPQSAA